MTTFLNVRSGPERGRQYSLKRGRTLHIGRGSTCEITLTDPIASRYHAVVYYQDGDWHVRDTSSRNGTEVNGQRIDNARLLVDSVVQIGDTELQLVDAEADTPIDSMLDTATVQIEPVDADRTFSPEDIPAAIRQTVSPTDQLMDLYSLSLSMMRGEDRGRVVATVVDLVQRRTGADIVAVSLLSPDDEPHLFKVTPADAADRVALTRTAVNRVGKRRESVWFHADQAAESEAVRRRFRCEDVTEAIYVPMIEEERCVGILHAYRESSRFKTEHHELMVAACRLAAAGLRQSETRALLRSLHRRDRDKNAITDQMLGEHPDIHALRRRIERVGGADGCVLIRGESGSGKELVARAVHRASGRSRRPMLTVNCAAIPENLVESQLFGHVKGSFTGAERDRAGWFAQADGGTLFMDEIAELPLEAQAKLLRVLEGHPFQPVGADHSVSADVRLIAATHRDLTQRVANGQFREDLFYRLSVFELNLPPLRARGSDIKLLVNHFFDHFRDQHGRPHLTLAPEALQKLLDHPWPGNVRQLRNVIDSAVVLADDPAVTPGDLGLHGNATTAFDTLRIDVWEKRLIEKAFEETGGNVTAAAKLLGVSRATAYRKIQEHGLVRDDDHGG